MTVHARDNCMVTLITVLVLEIESVRLSTYNSLSDTGIKAILLYQTIHCIVFYELLVSLESFVHLVKPIYEF